MDTANVKAGLTRKIGPLPLWAWGAVVIGGIVAARLLTGKGFGGSSGGVSGEFATAPAGEGSGGGSSGQGATGSGESVGGGTGTAGGGASGTSGGAGAGSAAGGSAGATAGEVDINTALSQPISTPTGEVFEPITPPSANAPAGPGAVISAQPVSSPSYIGSGDSYSTTAAPVSQKPSAGTTYVAPFVSSGGGVKHAPGTGPLVGDKDAESASKGSAGGVVGSATAAAMERARAKAAADAAKKEAAAEQERKRQVAIAEAKKRADAAAAEKKRIADAAAAAKRAAQQKVGTGQLQ